MPRLLLLLLIAASVAAQPCRRGFEVAPQLKYTWPDHVVTGDFNGDGRLDVAGLNSFWIYVGLQRGNDVFELVPLQQSHHSYGSVTVADSNGDGRLDLLAVAGSELHLYRGRGDGTFEEPLVSRPPEGGRFVDLDGDGRLDRVGLASGRAIAFSQGNADGTFTDRGSLPGFWNTFTTPDWTTGDFDGNGLVDVMILGEDQQTFVPYVRFAWNEGNFNFTAGTITILQAPLHRLGVVVADVDRDGADEAVLHGRDGVLVVDAAGRTVREATVPHVGSLGSMGPAASGDFDGDGWPDVVFRDSRSGIVILWGRPNGTGPLATTAFDLGFNGLTVVDLDGDGVDDLIGTISTGLSILRGKRGDRRLVAAPLSPARDLIQRMFAADVDGDGDRDIIGGDLNGVAILRVSNDGNGRFTERTPIPDLRVVAVGDFDGDGRIDIAGETVGGTPTARIVFGNGAWSFGSAIDVPNVSFSQRVAAVRVQDRDVLIVRGPLFADTPVMQVSVSSGRTASVTPLPAVPRATLLEAADVDGDGDTDLVALENRDARVFFQTAAGWQEREQPIPRFDGRELDAGDLNNDGLQDLVFRDDNGYEVYINQGDGSYRVTRYRDTLPLSLVLHDIDEDGFLDVLMSSRNLEWLAVNRNDGTGTMVPDGAYPLGDSPEGSFFVEDLDHDGWDDVAAVTKAGVAMLRNVCAPPRVRAVALQSVVREGQPVTLVMEFSGRVTVRLGETILAETEAQRVTLPVLPTGKHVLTVEADDSRAGRHSTTVMVQVVSPLKRRAVR